MGLNLPCILEETPMLDKCLGTLLDFTCFSMRKGVPEYLISIKKGDILVRKSCI